MNVSRMGRRLVVSGVATALAAAGLVGATDTAANAVESSPTTYSCVTALGTFAIPASLITDDLPTSMKAGQTQSGGAPVEIDFTVPPELAIGLGSLGITDLGSKDFALAVGGSDAKVDGLHLAGAMTPNTDGSLNGVLNGALADYAAPAAGSQQVTMPKAFTLTAISTALGEVDSPCTATGAPGGLGAVDVAKNASTTTVKAPARVAKGKVAKLVASVKGGFNTVTGKVVFKDGKKKLGTAKVRRGRAVFKAKGLKVGKHKITASYGGDGFRKGSRSKAVTLKVTR